MIIQRNMVVEKLVLFLLIISILISSAVGYSGPNRESVEKGIAYLETLQNADGGFSDIKGGKSNTRITEWIVMALSAVGEDTKSARSYILNNLEVKETTDYARALIALRASGYNGTVNGINLVDKIISFQKQNGQFSQYDRGENDMINAHVWSVFALASAGVEIPNKNNAREWLLSKQNSDGGFSWIDGGESDSDSTGVAITALILSGEPKISKAIKRAVVYLRNNQSENGGFSSGFNADNSASSSWATQGLIAAGEEPGSNAFNYLKGLQKQDGSFDWMEGRKSSPALMSAYAVMALAEKPFPVNYDYSGESQKVEIYIGNKAGLINGKNVTLDVAPLIIEGRTMVPLRFIGEALGVEIGWDGEKRQVTIRSNDRELFMIIGQQLPGMDSAPAILEGRTMVPIRYISENLGAKVTWFGEISKIEIEK